MAEPLKNQFGHEVIESIADDIGGAATSRGVDFDRSAFVATCIDGFDELELTARSMHIAAGLAQHLPEDRTLAMEIVEASLDHEPPDDEAGAMWAFRFLPHVHFVATYGQSDFEAAMRLQYEVTKRFTAEFSIRHYLVGEHRDATLERLRMWVDDPNEHVRRLVSEGTRTRLPWAGHLREFIENPEPVIALLEPLRHDPAEYVRRSVANNLNDIAKDHPERVIEVCRDWWAEIDHAAAEAGDEQAVRERWMIRHALRTLIKAAHPEALDVLGFGASSPVELASATIEPLVVTIGDKVRVELDLTNRSSEPGAALVDIRVHFVKANGATSPKVFKGAELECAPGRSVTVRKTVSLAQHSTRTHHSGTHVVEAIVNGVTAPIGSFELEQA